MYQPCLPGVATRPRARFVYSTVPILLIMSASIANGQQFVNGGFEMPNLVPNDSSVSFPTGTGWTFSGAHAGITEGPGGFGMYPAAPPEGDQSAYLRESSSVSQLVTGFEIGKQYRVEWEEGLSSNSNLGAELQLNLIDSNLQSTVIKSQHFVSNTKAWREQASDVFTASSTSYTFQFLSSMASNSFGGPTIDDVRITSGVFKPLPMEIDTQAQLAPDSTLTIDVLIGDQIVSRAIDDNLMGTVDLTLLIDQNNSVQQVRFGADVAPIHFQAGTIPIGLLGNLNFQFQNPQIKIGMLQPLSSGVWLDVVNGNSLPIDEMNLSFDGLFNYQTTGQLPFIIGSGGSLNLDILDTMISSNDKYDTIAVDPASFSLTPTGVPNQYRADVVLNIEYVGPLNAEYHIDGHVNARIHAQGLVVLPVPEMSSVVCLSSLFALCFPLIRNRRMSSKLDLAQDA